jgi:hypothetical protein
MVKIDLERRRQHGQRVRLEAHVKALPELGPLERLPADLVQAEQEARQQAGAAGQHVPEPAAAVRPPVVEAPARGGSVPPDWPTPMPEGLAGGAAPLPAQLGRYHILQKLGQGAMGAVYLAHDPQLDRWNVGV